MFERKWAAAAAILTIMTAASASAQSGWASIGTGNVTGETGRATIAAHGEPSYRQLMLCTDGHAVRMVDIVVTYADNHSQTIHDGERLASGDCGRMLDLNSRRQAVTSVQIVADVASLAGGTVRVDLFAR